MQSYTQIIQLKLRHPFGLARGTVTELPTVLFQLGDCGIGEAAPVRYLNQSAEEACALLAQMAEGVTEANIDEIEMHEQRALQIAPQHSAARAAFNIALWDARARRACKPLHELLGVEISTEPTSYTIALDSHEEMEQRGREATHLPAIKVKLGRGVEFDHLALCRVRAVAPHSRLRVDVNGGWSLQDALRMLPILKDLRVELLEQPLPIGALDDMARLREKSPIPIFADEDAQNLASLPQLVGKVDGINIKLMKCGGISEALRMIEFARAQNWQILLGCMIETRIGLNAAAQLSGRADFLDLDAHLLTTNDPIPPGNPADLTPTIPVLAGNGIGNESSAIVFLSR